MAYKRKTYSRKKRSSGRKSKRGRAVRTYHVSRGGIRL